MAQYLNMLVYGVSVLVLPGVVVWKEFIISDWVGWSLLFFLGLNTLLAYGALTEAMRYIPLTHVTLITTLNPLFTLITVRWVNIYQPGWMAQDFLGVAGWFGGFLIVIGIFLTVQKP